MNRSIFLGVIINLVLFSCASQTEKSENEEAINKFHDPEILAIAEWQDRRQTDSLIKTLQSAEPYLQKEAALALASVQDKEAIPALADLLNSSSDEVRSMAAYALGQTFDSTAFPHLINAFREEKKPEVKYSFLEAAGKTVTEQTIDDLLALEITSTGGAEGMGWALYRAGLNGVYNSSTTQSALTILDTASSQEAQLAASHYLSRIRNITVPDFGYVILKERSRSDNPEIRMAIASAYKAVPPQVAASIYNNFLSDEDYRVRINAIRSLPEVLLKDLPEEKIISLLEHKNPNVGIAMAEKLLAHAEVFPLDQLEQWTRKNQNKRIKALLFQTILREQPDNEMIIQEVREEFLQATSPYYKAGLLQALSESLKTYEFVVTETFKAKHPAISTAGISALAQMRTKEDFPELLKPAFVDIFKQAIESGDAALIDISSAVIREPELNFKKTFDNIDFLLEAKEELQLPKENETLQSLEKTIAYLQGVPYQPVVNKYNHPIHWETVKTLEHEHKATIKTEKGDVDLVLYTNKAPGSVLNFVDLARKGYYDNKIFHRVVPNFVVQGGGNRGDGWGGEDYSIRSEFADLKYTTGTIGMASAGKDTEGTQWFITHSPTPHLDGRYTIFAQVINGMDVVHQLQVGDTINTVIIK